MPRKSRPLRVTAEEALARGIEAEGYHAYFWCLVAIDLGEDEAEARRAMLEQAHLVAAEDATLAHFQLACWYAAGEHVARDARRARSHLTTALGGAKLRLDADLLKAITQVREHLGIPVRVDLDRPLGPAMPGTPGHVNRAQLDDAASPEPLRSTVRPATRSKPEAPTEDVYGIAASPDGQRLLSGGVTGELLLWDLRARSVIRRCQNAGGAVVDTLQFSPSGALAVIGSEDSRAVRILDLAANDFLVLDGHKGAAAAAAFLPDGAHLVSADHGGHLILWDLAARKAVATQQLARESLWSLAVSPDGRRLAVGDGDYTVGIYTLPALEPESALVQHAHLIHGLAFDATGQRLLSASRDHSIALWDLATASLIRTLDGHRACVHAAQFLSPQQAISAGLDGQILQWNLDTGTSTRIAAHAAIHSLAVVGDVVISGGEDGVCFDALPADAVARVFADGSS